MNYKIKPIKDYEGIYSITTNGMVLVHKRKRVDGRTFPKKFAKPFINNFGYYYVGLTKNRKRVKKSIHRLVAETFIKNPYNLKTVNHINGDRTNNRVENLEWMTYSENHIHSFRFLGRQVWNKGIRKDRTRMCPNCRIIFNANRKNQVYCGRKCSAKVNGSKPKRLYLKENNLLNNLLKDL